MSEASGGEDQRAGMGPWFWVAMAAAGSIAGMSYARWAEGVWDWSWATSWTLGTFIGWLIFRLISKFKRRT